jgi:hypothetical protein
VVLSQGLASRRHCHSLIAAISALGNRRRWRPQFWVKLGRAARSIDAADIGAGTGIRARMLAANGLRSVGRRGAQ